MKFYGGVRGSKSNNWLYFGSDPDHDPALVEVWALQVLENDDCLCIVNVA